MGTVYFVHCIDTEGPLMEAPDVPFQMIKRVFGLDIPASSENLRKLRKGEMPLNGLEQSVADLVDPRKMCLGTWTEIDRSLEVITSPDYRRELPDSTGGGWKYTWCCVNHTGFHGENPRHRDAGYNNIYDHYRRMVDEQQSGDVIGFHYHPLPLSGNFHDSGTAYWGGENLNQILAHAVLDRHWFPSVFRPGFNTERPDANWFLEQWIPFDYANNAVCRQNSDQPDLTAGRFGDWRRAPAQWRPYHPSHDDYQTEGNCRRSIFRILNMYARVCEIQESDIREGFERARNGEDTVIAVADHDYKDMKFDIDRVREMLRTVTADYPEVPFVYTDGITAARKVLGLKPAAPGLQLRLDRSGIFPRLEITAEENLFGPQPFLAIRSGNTYHWDNLDFADDHVWSYTFDSNTIELSDVRNIGVAGNSTSGVAEVCTLDPATMEASHTVWDQ